VPLDVLKKEGRTIHRIFFSDDLRYLVVPVNLCLYPLLLAFFFQQVNPRPQIAVRHWSTS